MASAGGRIRIQWVRSAIAAPEKHKRIVRGLGFTRLRQVVEREDTPAIRGMVEKIPHLVRIVEPEAGANGRVRTRREGQ